MNKLNKSLSLLPSLLPRGFEDLLPPDAEAEFRAIGILMKCFSRFGYARVKPPLAEFEESLLAPGPGAAMADQTFRVMDPLSEKMLALRSDITAQIARVASSRLADEPRPLRLTYANDALRTRASQQRTLRQFCQVGCELISDEDIEADLEICVLSLIGLSALGIERITLDFCLPRLLSVVVKDESLVSYVKASLNARNEQALDTLDPALKSTLVAMLQAAGPVDKAFEKLGHIELPQEAHGMIDRLKTIVDRLKTALSDLKLNVALTLDVTETKGFEYHCGIGFTVFARGVNGELGRGGRYNIVHSDSDAHKESAAGFTLYMDTVRIAMPGLAEKSVKEVSADTPWTDIQSLQEDGFIVKRKI